MKTKKRWGPPVDFWFLIAKLTTLLGIIIFCIKTYPKLIESNEAVTGLVFIGICLVFFIVDNIILRHKINKVIRERDLLEKRANYVRVIPNLNSGFARIHDLIRRNIIEPINPNKSERLSAFVHLCDKLANAFKDLTGEQCNVCIKVFEKEKDVPLNSEDQNLIKVITLCRDSENNSSREFSKNTEHYVSKNTDFYQIFENIGGPDGEKFFENELPLLIPYLNTSFPIYEKKLTYQGLQSTLSKADRIKYWPLPYKSTIVVPICPHSGCKATIDEVIGFLCVDCSSMNVFDKENHYNILIGVADGIYHPLSRWMTIGFK